MTRALSHSRTRNASEFSRLAFTRTVAVMVAVVFSTLVTFSSKASAHEPVFGESGHLALSIERMTGLTHSSQTFGGVGGDTTSSLDAFTLLGNAVGSSTAYGWPRLALDIFVVNHLSVGAAASFFVVSPSTGSLTGVLLAARVGYAATLASRVGIWPRVGFSYERTSADSNVGLERNLATSFLALSLDVPVAIFLAPRIGLLVGPTIDLGLGGSRASTTGAVTTSVSARATEYGFNAGFLFYF
jgi:hypothetical protein